MANEKIENVTNVAKKTELVKPVTFRRRYFKTVENGVLKEFKYIECSTEMKGESVRFKVDDKDSKLVKMLMRMYGYALVDQDGNIVEEDSLPSEL